jgi:hypothetical protein
MYCSNKGTSGISSGHNNSLLTFIRSRLFVFGREKILPTATSTPEISSFTTNSFIHRTSWPSTTSSTSRPSCVRVKEAREARAEQSPYKARLFQGLLSTSVSPAVLSGAPILFLPLTVCTNASLSLVLCPHCLHSLSIVITTLVPSFIQSRDGFSRPPTRQAKKDGRKHHKQRCQLKTIM